MLPPTMSTTPNSPTVWAKLMMTPVTSPGRHSGSTTLKNVSSGEARRLAATSSGRLPMASMALCTGCTMKGSE
ncbi:hypothetical protein Y695_04827 [Hydrogenophaga sp. T4]|nr:hypothetical protein Y695_04827 [Hydrogenophaga sp. T4]